MEGLKKAAKRKSVSSAKNENEETLNVKDKR
jgi:hypothetical protein